MMMSSPFLFGQHWTDPGDTGYNQSMSLFAQIFLDDDVQEGNYEVAAFYNDELLGVGQIVPLTGTTSNYHVHLNVQGNTTLNGIYFKFFNGTNEYVSSTEMSFTEGLKGSHSNYEPINFYSVAQIGDVVYPSLQKAINACKEGDNTIELLADNAEDVTIKQVEGVNVTIDGGTSRFVYSGTITIHGNARYQGAETLTFTNIDFTTDKAGHYFIDSNSTGSVERYAHNVTVSNCNFTATDAGVNSAAAMRIRQGFDIAINGGTFTNLHSVLQAYGNAGINITGITSNCKNGISVGSSTNVVITNSEITATGATGYGVRAGENVTGPLTITDTKINAFIPVSVRKVTDDTNCEFTFTGNTMTASNTDGYWCVIGTSEYEANGSLPETAGKIIVNATEQDLAGVYGYSRVEVTFDDSTKKYFYMMEDAVPYNNADNYEGATIKLLSNCAGIGLRFWENGMTFDLNGKNYTITQAVGSSGTESQGFQIRPEVTGNVTIKNGTIDIKAGTNVKWMFNSYAADFVVKDVTIDGANMVTNTSEDYLLVVQNAGDQATFDNVTINNYTAKKVYLEGNTTFVAPQEFDNIEIPAGYVLNYADGKYTVVPGDVELQRNGVSQGRFASIAEAIAAAEANDVIVLLADITENVTVNKSVTIDGKAEGATANSKYTGKIIISGNVNVTINEVAFVDGFVEHTSSNNTGTITVKYCSFANGGYAITTSRIKSVTIENCEVTNQSLLYAKLSISDIVVKNVNISKGNYVAHIVYGSTAYFENVNATEMTGYGIQTQNYGAKTITINNCKFETPNYNSIAVRDDRTEAIDTFIFKGTNEMTSLRDTDKANYVLAEVDATLTAPEGYTVTTTVADHIVKYKDGKYIVVGANVQVKDGDEVKGTFATLAEAITAAQAGNTIVLLANITEDVTVNKNLTLDGAGKNYTGKITLNKVNFTAENVNFVKGNIYKNKDTGVGGTYTIKNCTFDGQSMNDYAVNLGGTSAIVIEGVTAKYYGYGFLQVPASNTSVSVKDVEISNVNYGLKIDYSGGVTLENVKAVASVAGVLNSNYGAKTITIKNSELSILGTWTRNNTTKTTYVFEGANSIDEFVIDAAIDNFKLADVNSTLTAPNNITVTTDVENSIVVYENGMYKVKPAVASITADDNTTTYYETLADAVEAATAGQTVELIADAIGAGLKINKDVTIDFGGFTYTINQAVGSTGTESQGFQLLKNNTVTLKNGTIDIVAGTNVKWMFNAYADVTLENLNVNCANMAAPAENEANYVLVVNNGGSATPTVTYTNVIVTNFPSTATAQIWLDPTTTLKAGAGLENSIETEEGYVVVYNNGEYTAIGAVAKIGEAIYPSVAAAVAAAQAGNVIELLVNVTEDVTVDKSVTIDGANFQYTGNISVSGTSTDITVKNVNFVNGTGYAITTNRIKSVTVENCTVTNYGFGFLYANKSTPTVVVKNVTVDGGNYGFHWVYGTTATLENVTMTNVTYGLYIQNYAGKTINVKNSTISSIGIWERSGYSGVQTFNFKGVNTVGTLTSSQYAKYVLAATDATLTAPEGYTVTTTVENSLVKYVDGAYKVVPAVAKIGDVCYETLADAIAAIGEGDVVIELLADVTFDYNARDAYGTASTSSLTINGNGKTLTLNQKNSDWASFGLANADAKVVFNNMIIEKTGYGDTSGAWNTHTIIFSSNVEMTDVTVNNSMAVQNGATLNNVTIYEANGYYGLWINGNGQTVTMNGGSITATNGGRGIKIADQYIDAPALVTLNVTGTTFNTAEKAAVLVSSKAGAVITASNVDITDVTEDNVNFAWVDEDWAAHYGKVTVTGGTLTQENLPVFVAALMNNAKVEGYYKVFEEALAAAEDEKILVLKTVVFDTDKEIDFEGKEVNSNVNPAFRITNDATVTVKNGNMNTAEGYNFILGASDSSSAGNLTIESGTFHGATTVASVTMGSLNITGGEFSVEPYQGNYAFLINCYDPNYNNGAEVSISGGTFHKWNPENNAAEGVNTNFCAQGYAANEIETGVYEVVAGMVLNQTKGIKYATLQAAIDAAENGDEIVVLKDITLGTGETREYTTTSGGTVSVRALNLISGKSVTIDLNGNTLYCEEEAEENQIYNFFAVTEEGHLTIKDSSEDGIGTVEIKNNDADATTVHSLIMCYNGTMTIENGNYKLHYGKNGNGMIYSQQSETVTVNGGNFWLGNVGTLENHSPWIFNASGRNGNRIIVNGGTFNDDVLHQYYAFEVESSVKNALVNNNNGTWSVITNGAVAHVTERYVYPANYTTNYTNTVGYATLKDAFAAAHTYNYVTEEEMSTVTMLKDVTLDAYVTISKSVNLNLDQFNITREDGTALYFNGEGIEVTINGEGTVSGTQAVYVDNGTVTINGGNYVGGYEAVYVINNGHAVIYGGTFGAENDEDDTDFVLNEYDATRDVTTIAVYGGTFHGFNPENNAAEGAGTNFCAQGYGAVETSTGSNIWEVMPVQKQSLVAGWNWYSSYLKIKSEDLLLALGTNGSAVVSDNGGGDAYYEESYGWDNSLTENLDLSKMYMIETSIACDLNLAGELADASTITITLNPGWNWIGYPSNVKTRISDAFSGFTPDNGDVIKTKANSFAEYYEGQWYDGGVDMTMEPTKGYMYYNASLDVTKTFTYNIVPVTTRGNNETAVATHYSVDYTKYPFNMTMVAVVDGAMNDNYEVAALVNGEVRGSARPVYIESMDAYMLFLSINGDAVEEMTFKYYDLTTGEEYDLVNRIDYSNNAMVGSVNEPYVLSRGTTGIGEAAMSQVNIYPNPTTTGTEINLQTVCDTVEVFNALGVKVAEYQNVDTVDALETAGIYVIRITNDGNVQNCRLVVK